ncbi:hypothetical protein Pmani_008118 [Petrolisthes manimaculis]|uniref:Ig-like domain-containing protein n=1 Tax=Petrolisthes manimaculis TaxID=1843537 RepID=A0AAE1Q712_9EUCA|nr:hypothetical protein Pmani_008118 [Petrolisthes manimaculis]
MASTTSTLTKILLCTSCLLNIDIISTNGFQVTLGPRDVRKYVGDSLRLMCAVTDHTNTHHHDPQIKYVWVIPRNDAGLVELTDTPGGGSSILTITDLQETDGGNYSCQAQTTTTTTHNTSRASVRIVVLPRGDFSHCDGDSFRCITSGHCINNRYKCDGRADCPRDASDETEQQCGREPCAGKLRCDDGRCLSPHLCCRELGQSPPNCTIRSTIVCCRQLVHPALLDQDLFYMNTQPSLQHQRTPQPHSTLVMGCIVAVANLVTVAIIVGVRYHLWRSNNNNNNTTWHLNRLRPFGLGSSPPHPHLHPHPPPPHPHGLRLATLLRPFGLGSSPPPHPHPPLLSSTDQYQLGSSTATADSLYVRRLPIPGLRSDLLSLEILQGQRHSQRPYGGVILCPPTHAQPPQYSQLHPHRPPHPQGPPPSYQQVVGAPPPPYYSGDDLTAAAGGGDGGGGGASDASSLSLLAPLLSTYNNNNNNNNEDINGNTPAPSPQPPTV